MSAANAAKRQRRADAHRRADLLAQRRNHLVGLLTAPLRSGRPSSANSCRRAGDFLDRELRRFRAAGQSADAVRHAEQHRVFIEQDSGLRFLGGPGRCR